MSTFLNRWGTVFFAVCLALFYPALTVGPANLLWNLNTVALIALTVVVAIIAAAHPARWLLALALVLAVLTSWGQWLVLPLALAQIGLALVLGSQALSDGTLVCGLLIQGAFIQIILGTTQMHTLPQTFLIAIVCQLAPVALTVWAKRLPIAVTLLANLAIIIAAYSLQQFTLLTGIIIAAWVAAAVFSKHPWPRWVWIASAIGIGIVMHFAVLHG